PVEQVRLEAVDGQAWYPFATLVHLDRAIASRLAPGDPAIFDRLGAASARHRGEWLQDHAQLVRVPTYLSRVADDHRRFQTFGRAVYKRQGFTGGELSFSKYPELDESYCLSAMGYLRASVEILTDGPVQAEERQCQRRGDPACVFSFHW